MPPLLFGLPRSGTTLFYNLIAEYLSQRANVRGLGEFFAVRALEAWDTGDGIGTRWYEPAQRPPRETLLRTLSSDLKLRMDLLRKYHGSIFFKLTNTHLGAADLNWLRENYDWIFVERKNLFELALSFCISWSTDLWYPPGGMKIEKGSVEISSQSLALFVTEYRMYQRIRSLFPLAPICVYEDFVKTFDANAVLRGLGFDAPFDSGLVRYPEKQNVGNKLAYLRNPEGFVEAYRRSFLATIYPI